MEQTCSIQFKNTNVTGYYGQLTKSLPKIAECLLKIFNRIINGTIRLARQDDIYVTKECGHYILMSRDDRKNRYYLEHLIKADQDS